MEEKLRRLMKHEGINSTRLAEMLGVQASGISHIMSGRNQPSGAFLMKLLQRFPQINPDWLLLNKGQMYRDGVKSATHIATPSLASGIVPGSGAPPSSYESAGLFAGTGGGSVAGAESFGANGANSAAERGTGWAPDNDAIIPSGDRRSDSVADPIPTSFPTSVTNSHPPADIHSVNLERSSSIERIVVFYKDKTFSEYQPK